VEGHANAENLSGAEVAVSDLGFLEEMVQGLHTVSVVD
jgi:hypothetical protein